jgi:Na+/H+-dicarboxylate symporter
MLKNMKVWIKLLLGAALGVLLGFLLPEGNQAITGALSWLETFAIRLGRYALAPILVFSVTIAIYELRQEGRFWRTLLLIGAVLAALAAFTIACAVASTLLFSPSRIPILIGEQLETISLDIPGGILELFPPNMLQTLSGDGVYLMPLCVFSFFVAIGLSYDKNLAKPVVTLLDSLSRIFYHIASFLSELLGLVIIVLAAQWAVRFHAFLPAGAFLSIMRLLTIFSLIFCFVVLPLLLFLIKPKLNPFLQLYGSLGTAITAFFSGDINFTLPVLLQNAKENLGVRRRVNAVTLSLFAVFGRAGSAAVAAVSFIVIIKSYSSLGVTSAAVISLALRAFVISLLLSRHPGDGAYTALAVLCANYGDGFEAGYLILKPMAFYLIAIGTFLDAMIAIFATSMIAGLTGGQEERQSKNFI